MSVLKKRAIRASGEVDVYLHAFYTWTSALGGGGGQRIGLRALDQEQVWHKTALEDVE